MDEKYAKAWQKFLAGHWQKELPSREGTYPIATTAGDQAGTSIVYIYPNTGEACSVRPWGGYWWSEPIPDLPPPVVRPECGCHCEGGCGDPYAACMYPCNECIPF
ncbi:hypothetical protein [Myxococcus phage Mx1]|nr:hypothetical protein [Myxococcus phage Mx1]